MNRKSHRVCFHGVRTPLLGRRPASKRTRAVQRAESLLAEEAQVAVGALSRGAFPPEGLGKLPGCDVHAKSGRVLNGERKNRAGGRAGGDTSAEGELEGLWLSVAT